MSNGMPSDADVAPPDRFPPPEPIEFLVSGPVVTDGYGNVDVFALDADHRVVQEHLKDDVPWKEFMPHGGPALAPPAAITRYAETVDLFMVGADSTLCFKQMVGYHRDSQVWEPAGQLWHGIDTDETIGVMGRPAPMAFGEGGLGVAVVGTDSIPYVYHTPNLRDWRVLRHPGAPRSRYAPRAVSTYEEANVFVTGWDGHVYHLSMDPNGEGNWVDLGAPLDPGGREWSVSVSRPGALLTLDRELMVFMLGRAMDGRSKTRTASGWPLKWADCFGNKATPPDGVAAPGSGHDYDLFNRHEDSTIFHMWSTGGQRGWRTHPVPDAHTWLLGPPHAVSPHYQKLALFALCTDSFIHYRIAEWGSTSTGPDWVWGSWERLSGGEMATL